MKKTKKQINRMRKIWKANKEIAWIKDSLVRRCIEMEHQMRRHWCDPLPDSPERDIMYLVRDLKEVVGDKQWEKEFGYLESENE